MKPIFTTDPDGAAVVLVPLTNYDQPAKLLLADFDELIGLGISPLWSLHTANVGYRYVRTKTKSDGALCMVARLILQPWSHQSIRYADRNQLNLRRDNLYLRASKTPGRLRKALPVITTTPIWTPDRTHV